jgi:nitrite reductase/ring-hydroxylating ferredoxin subunit
MLRQREERRAGRGFALLGFVASTAAAYLGGKLVYRYRVGVDRAAEVSPPRDFVPVMAETDLRENELRRVEATRMPILLVRRQGQIYALAETCSHLSGPLAEGQLEGNSVVCPWHGSRFALADGRVLNGPATHPQLCFETRVRNGQIEVRATR